MLRAFLILFALWQPVAVLAQGKMELHAEAPEVLGKTPEEIRLALGEPDTTIAPQYGDLMWMYKNVENKGPIYVYRFLDGRSIQFTVGVKAPKKDRMSIAANSLAKRRVDEAVRKLRAKGIVFDQTDSRAVYEFGSSQDGYIYTINALFGQYLFTVWRKEHRDQYEMR